MLEQKYNIENQHIPLVFICMKLAGIPVSVILILFAAAFLFLKYSLSSNPLLLFSLFNTIILAITVGSFRPCTYEADEILPFFCDTDELGIIDTRDDIMEYSDDDDDDDYDHEHHGSDGYDEDDDDNSSDDEVGWEDDDSSRNDEGYDDNLQKRIEDFIAEAYSRWKEEKLRDNHS